MLSTLDEALTLGASDWANSVRAMERSRKVLALASSKAGCELLNGENSYLLLYCL